MISVETAFVLAFFVFSVVVHEVMHGWTADYYGDPTARNAGRLSFDPLVHIDPFMTILMPLLLIYSGGPVFGGAKPVPVNPYQVRPFKKGNLMVSIAGPASNVVLAIAFALVTRLLLMLNPNGQWGEPVTAVTAACAVVVFYNLYLAIFNMVPIPPLDGGHVAVLLLPKDAGSRLERLEPYGFFIIYGLVVLGATVFLVVPIAGFTRMLLGAEGFRLALMYFHS